MDAKLKRSVSAGECLSECSGSSQGEAVDAEPDAPLRRSHRHSSEENMQYPTSSWLQFAVLFRRMLLQIYRNKVRCSTVAVRLQCGCSEINTKLPCKVIL